MNKADDQWWSYRLIPAGFAMRTVAAAVDGLLVLAVVTAFFWFFRDLDELVQRLVDPVLREGLARGVIVENVTRILGLSFLLSIVYGVVGEASPWGGTPGKRLVGIHVVDEFGERISLTTSIVRNLVKVVSLAALGIGCFAALWRSGARTWHDQIARTFAARG